MYKALLVKNNRFLPRVLFRNCTLNRNFLQAINPLNPRYIKGLGDLFDLVKVLVGAINAKQIKVVFNQIVDKASAETPANYTIKVNGSTLNIDATKHAKLLDDKKSVLLTNYDGAGNQFGDYTNLLASGNSYQVIVEKVMNANYAAMSKYESPVLAFIDTAAPVVQSAEYDGGVVKVYFNEPINPATTDYKVDGGTLVENSMTSVINKEKYYVQFTATTDQKKVGSHTVTLYSIVDALGKSEAVASATYSVAADSAAPYVSSISADGMYTFKVIFSEAINAEPTVVVKKGSLQLPLDSGVGGGDGIAIDTSDTSGKTYKVTVTDLSTDNKVYATGESSVNLTVQVKGYFDAANNAGSEYNGSVTLTKDTTKPAVKNVGLNKGVVVGGADNDLLEITFDEVLAATIDGDGVDNGKVTVKKDNVILNITGDSIVTNDSGGKAKVVQIPLGADLAAGTYTVELSAGAIADLAGNKNAAISTTVTWTDSSAYITAAIADVSTNKFSVTFTTTPDMSDSAIDVANYTLDGAALPSDTTIGFFGTKKVVHIKLPSGSIINSSSGLLRVSKNVVNKDGVKVLASVNPDVEQTGTVTLTDNVKPTMASAKYYVSSSSDTTTNQIKVTFSENLATVENDAANRNDFKVMINGVKQTVSAVSDITGGDKYVVLTLGSAVNVNQTATVSIIAEADQDGDKTIVITDVATNKAAEGTSVDTSGTELNVDAAAGLAGAQAVAASLGTAFAAGDNSQASGTVILPTVPTGYSIAVSSTATPANYSATGAALQDGSSVVVFTVTHTATGQTANTGNVTVTVDVAP